MGPSGGDTRPSSWHVGTRSWHSPLPLRLSMVIAKERREKSPSSTEATSPNWRWVLLAGLHGCQSLQLGKKASLLNCKHPDLMFTFRIRITGRRNVVALEGQDFGSISGHCQHHCGPSVLGGVRERPGPGGS